MPDFVLEAVTPAMFVAGNRIAVEAQISITDGAVSGENHVPSFPGQPPNNDTGVLANNIETVQIDPLTVEVSSNAPYSEELEFGSSRVAARPFMAPAARKKAPEARNIVRRAVLAAVRRKLREASNRGRS